MKNWAMTVTAAAITGIAFGAAGTKYPNEQMFVGVVVVYVFVLRFFVRAMICYVNLTRWNKLQESCINYKLLRRNNDGCIQSDQASLLQLRTDIYHYYQRWTSPLTRKTQLISNLKLGFALLFILPLFFGFCAIWTLWSSPLVQALTVFALGGTAIEFGDFATNIIFDDMNARTKRDEKHKKSKKGRDQRDAFPIPSTRSYYMSAWCVVLFLSLGVALIQTRRSHVYEKAHSPGESSQATQAIVHFSSSPTGANIAVDDRHVGFTPATLPLLPGTRHILISLAGYMDDLGQITVIGGGEQTYSTVLHPALENKEGPAGTKKGKH
jgi:hypothetical protein